jgi:hypothetical protein
MAHIHAINGLNGELIKWREPELHRTSVSVINIKLIGCWYWTKCFHKQMWLLEAVDRDCGTRIQLTWRMVKIIIFHVRI